MTEKREERNAIRREDDIIALIFVFFIISIFVCFAITGVWIIKSTTDKSVACAIIFLFSWVMGSIILVCKIVKKLDDNCRIKQETENMEKAKEILSYSTYTPIKFNIDTCDIQSVYKSVEALERKIAFEQEKTIKKFNCTLAAKLSEDKVLYAIVDENGNEIGPININNTATFFINNFEKI